MPKHLLSACILALAALLQLAAAASAADEPQRATLQVMGGVAVNISAWGIGQSAFSQAVLNIDARFQYLEAMLSTYKPDSEISRLNRGESVKLPPEFIEVVKAALGYSRQTDGAFDVTVQPLIALWKKCAQQNRLPTDAERSEALEGVGYRHVKLEGDKLSIDEPGVQLDFGGIAQGYFADEAVALLREAGARRCLVEVSGDIMSWQARDERPFTVGIKDPQHPEELLAVVSMDSGGVTTSGDYERFYEIQGKRYCHIFDPRTGQPISGMASVTLFAPTGIAADALATAVFVMGPTAGARFVEQHKELQAVIVCEVPSPGAGPGEAEYEVYVSPGLRDRISYPQAENRSPKAAPVPK
jgi:thiamine biosynthesis lipoprotein